MSETLARVKSLAENAALYIPEDCESMRIVACVEEHFLTEGEETGESYQIYFSEVDLENDIFYYLKLKMATNLYKLYGEKF